MIAPQPLFGGEAAEEAPLRPGITVERLDLDGEAAAPPPRISVTAVGGGEAAGLRQAMERGVAAFPAVMQASGYLVRNNLNQLLPLDFDKLAGFGRDTLERAARLIGEVAGLNGRLHEVDAPGIIGRVVQGAQAHAARGQASLRGLLSGLVPFDAAAAGQQITSLQRALRLRLDQVAAVAEAMQRLQATLSVEVTTLAILEDMSDRGAMGELLARRSLLLTASLQELSAALRQVESMRLQVQEWTMRCDEVRAVTLPALGYTASLSLG